MKKVIYIITVATGLTFLGACKNTFDAPNKSALDASVVFSTPGLAQSAIAGILQSFGEQNSYRGRYLVYYGLNTDVEVASSLKDVTTVKSTLTNYNTSSNNTEMSEYKNAWAKFYEGIERANIAIAGLRKYGNVESNPDMAQILGEVLTLRAVLYNDLIKGWGNVPARFEPITSETAYIPRSDKDVIFKQLLADLDEAASLLPWPNETAVTSSVEHVNKAFAKGLRARLALYAGGYSKHLDGETRLSNDPDLSREKMYTIARDECIDIINSKKLNLLSFEQVFRTLCEETNKAGLESMWEIPFADGRGRVLYNLGVEHKTKDKYTQQAQGGDNGPNPAIFYDFDKDDVRRDVSVVPYLWDGGIQVPSSLNKLYFGKYRYEWMKRIVTADNDDGLNWMYMRYADIYLMAAEAINELQSPSEAAPYLQKILERAFPTRADKVTAYMAEATKSKGDFFNAIVDQRAFEFCGEMLRKADLIRWNKLGEKLRESKVKLQQLNNREGKYASLPKKIYYKNNGEDIVIYGLNYGDTDAIGQGLSGYSAKDWKLSPETDAVKYWDGLFVKDPDSQPVWPIWDYFILNSNGTLNNDNF